MPFRIERYEKDKKPIVDEVENFWEVELSLSDLLGDLEYEAITGFTISRIEG
jgi:hypothetical protein